MANINSLFSWLGPKSAKDSNHVTPITPYMHVGTGVTRTGEIVTPESALENSTVFACVNFIAQSVAQLPWAVVDKQSESFVPAQHDLSKLMLKPAKGLTPYELKYQVVVDLLTYGNAYLLKVKTSSGKVIELIPMPAAEMTPNLSWSGGRSYKHEGGKTYKADEIIHVRDFIGGSVQGLSKVKQCCNLVGIDNAIDYYLADTFRNGTGIGGVVSFPENVDPEVASKFISLWEEKFSGHGKSRGSVAVLSGGAKFVQTNPLSPGDADLQNLKTQCMTRIAAIFKVPAYAIEVSDGSKYDNLSQRSMGFYRDSISPIVKNIEAKMTEALINDPAFCIKFDSTELIKGDLQTTTRIAVEAVNSKIITRNEARKLMGFSDAEGDGGFIEDAKPTQLPSENEPRESGANGEQS